MHARIAMLPALSGWSPFPSPLSSAPILPRKGRNMPLWNRFEPCGCVKPGRQIANDSHQARVVHEIGCVTHEHPHAPPLTFLTPIDQLACHFQDKNLYPAVIEVISPTFPIAICSDRLLMHMA